MVGFDSPSFIINGFHADKVVEAHVGIAEGREQHGVPEAAICDDLESLLRAPVRQHKRVALSSGDVEVNRVHELAFLEVDSAAALLEQIVLLRLVDVVDAFE